MAFNIIYKGEKVGQQVDFQTGSLTDISTFDTDVRSSAIQNLISSSETEIGASQAAIWNMSGYLAANAHPDVNPASDISIDNSNGTVLQDATFTFDADGHVTDATFTSVDLDSRYTQTGAFHTSSGHLVTYIDAGDLVNKGYIDVTSGKADANKGYIDDVSGLADVNTTDIVTLSGLIDIVEGATLQTATDNGSFTDRSIEVSGLRVSGDGTSASITGPATIIIDPDSEGAAGTVVIQGDLQVEGTTTTINSTEVQVGDKSLILGTGAVDNSAMNGGGIILSGTTEKVAEFTYNGTSDRWVSSLDIEANIVGTASSAENWASARSITFEGGDVTGVIAALDGSNNVSNVDLTIAPGSITSGMIVNGQVANGTLENSSISIGGITLSLGGSDATPQLNLSDATGYATTALVGTITNDQLAGSIETGKLAASTVSYGGVQLGLGESDATPAFNLTSATNYPTTSLVGTITNDQLAGSIANGKLANSSAEIGGVNIVLGQDIAQPAFDLTSATNYPTSSLVGTITNDQLAGSIANTKLVNSSVTVTASNGLSGGGSASLGGSTSLSTSSDQSHLNEVEYGADDNSITNVTTKGGVLILRATSNSGISQTPSSNEIGIQLNDKTTVAFEGIVQSARTDQDGDDGSYVAMWKVQGVLRRDQDSTSMLQSFVTKTFAGADATGYGLDVSVDSNYLRIASDQTNANLVTCGTINYNWIEDTTA